MFLLFFFSYDYSVHYIHGKILDRYFNDDQKNSSNVILSRNII